MTSNFFVLPMRIECIKARLCHGFFACAPTLSWDTSPNGNSKTTHNPPIRHAHHAFKGPNHVSSSFKAAWTYPWCYLWDSEKSKKIPQRTRSLLVDVSLSFSSISLPIFWTVTWVCFIAHWARWSLKLKKNKTSFINSPTTLSTLEATDYGAPLQFKVQS